MSEWWTYRPSDFLMFAPDTYWRQFELHNAALWPWVLLPSVVLLALLAVVLASPSRHGTTLLRCGLAGSALCWGFVAWSFLWQRYAPINWAAQWFAIGFAAQAIGLLAMAGLSDIRLTRERTRRACALMLLIWAAVAHPLLTPIWGRPLAQAEWLGTVPDPTALATLGGLLWTEAGSRAGRWLLRTLQGGTLLWCAISAATLWTMGAAQAGVLLAAGLLTLGALWRWPPRQAG